MSNPIKEDAPSNRLGRIAEAMLEAGQNHPEASENDLLIVLLDDYRNGMTAFSGYEHDSQVFNELIRHAKRVIELNGGDLNVLKLSDLAGGQN